MKINSKITQQHIAALANVSAAHIHNIANGKRGVSKKLATRLAAIFTNTKWHEWIDDPEQTWIKANCTTAQPGNPTGKD